MGDMGDNRLPSERVVISAPMSFAGSARRLWKPVHGKPVAAAIPIGFIMAVLILTAWTMVMAWYFMFGLLVVPWRVLRRGSRKEKAAKLRHQETLEAIRKQQR